LRCAHNTDGIRHDEIGTFDNLMVRGISPSEHCHLCAERNHVGEATLGEQLLDPPLRLVHSNRVYARAQNAQRSIR
jgi:hypothetical protein